MKDPKKNKKSKAIDSHDEQKNTDKTFINQDQTLEKGGIELEESPASNNYLDEDSILSSNTPTRDALVDKLQSVLNGEDDGEKFEGGDSEEIETKPFVQLSHK